MARRIAIVMMAVGLCAAASQAAINATGDVIPADPATWTSATSASIGATGVGSLTVDGDSDLLSSSAGIGFSGTGIGEVTITDPGTTWTMGGHITVGSSGDGTMNVLNGAAVTSTAGNKIGHLAGSTGEVTINGVDSSWTVKSDFNVGELGSGTLSITGGGTMVSNWSDGSTTNFLGSWTGATGVVTVDGVGSTWTGVRRIVVGMRGHGELNITGGGQVISDHSNRVDHYIGYWWDGTGVATVDGAGSAWIDGGSVEVGNGTLSVTNGGQVDMGIYIKARAGAASEVHLDNGTITTGTLYAEVGQLTGTGTVNAHGIFSDIDLVFDSPEDLTQTLTWDSLPGQNITINLDVSGQGVLGAGYAGSGSIAISNGVQVTSMEAHVGHEAGSTGVATVDGAGSSWTTTALTRSAKPWMDTGDLDVGYYGDGMLSITDGGAVASMIGHIGFHLGSTGAVTVDGAGSTLTMAGYDSFLHVGSEGAGLLTITSGGLVSVEQDLAIDFDGGGDSFINMATGGMLALYGQADDSLASFLALIDGMDAIQYGGIDILDWDTAGLDYQLAYLTGGDLAGYTMLTMNSGWGDFDLDTDVDALDIDALGDAIRLDLAETMYDLSGAGEDGTPDGVIDINDLDYLIHQLVETAIGSGTEYGDFNLDGLVDTTDLTRLATYYGTGTMWSEGNANRNIDLTTDTTDLTILATYYGFGVPDTVPEPATLSLLAMGACLPLLRKRR